MGGSLLQRFVEESAEFQAVLKYCDHSVPTYAASAIALQSYWYHDKDGPGALTVMLCIALLHG